MKIPNFCHCYESPHFCHPETDSISLTGEGSIFRIMLLFIVVW